jgi:hypothetical protein
VRKINIPQLFVSYAGGSGGEWLAYQLGMHDKYFQFHQGNLQAKSNELNRWRIKSGWRSELIDNTDWKKTGWYDEEYDGSSEWWNRYWESAANKDYWYEWVSDYIFTRNNNISIHRCHEAWQESVFFKDLFEELKVISISIDTKDQESIRQFQSNIIKKIFWQDLVSQEDLEDEMQDKCKKFKVDYAKAFTLTQKMSGVINYTDMMLAVDSAKGSLNPIEETMLKLSERWNDYNINQHHMPIPGDHMIINFRKLFIEKDYQTYLDICNFIKVNPWDESHFHTVFDEYVDKDIDESITLEQVYSRLENRMAEINE